MRDPAARTADVPELVEPREATLDTSAPSTSIQLRLADGSRRVLKLNHTHTVGQLRAHVATLVAPGTRFELAIPVPRAKLVDNSVTVAAAGLLNNTVVVSTI